MDHNILLEYKLHQTAPNHEHLHPSYHISPLSRSTILLRSLLEVPGNNQIKCYSLNIHKTYLALRTSTKHKQINKLHLDS